MEYSEDSGSSGNPNLIRTSTLVNRRPVAMSVFDHVCVSITLTPLQMYTMFNNNASQDESLSNHAQTPAHPRTHTHTQISLTRWFGLREGGRDEYEGNCRD